MAASSREGLPGAVARMVAALVRRASDGDDEALDAIIELRASTRAAVPIAAAKLHESGYSWAEVGARLGVTRQAAEQMVSRARAVRPSPGG